jgi:hypothetical protein
MPAAGRPGGCVEPADAKTCRRIVAKRHESAECQTSATYRSFIPASSQPIQDAGIFAAK